MGGGDPHGVCGVGASGVLGVGGCGLVIDRLLTGDPNDGVGSGIILCSFSGVFRSMRLFRRYSLPCGPALTMCDLGVVGSALMYSAGFQPFGVQILTASPGFRSGLGFVLRS